MEAGENPARSRHCKEGAAVHNATADFAPAGVMLREGGQGDESQVRRHA